MDDSLPPIDYQPMMPRMGPTAPIVSMPEEILRLILDPSKTTEAIRHQLRGEVLVWKEFTNDDGKKVVLAVWEKQGMRQMNDRGIEYVISKLESYVSRNVIFTQLTEDDILMITKTIDKNIAKVFAAKYQDFEIDKAHMTDIKDDIVHQCFFAMKQSQNKALMDALTKLVSISEVKDTSPSSGFKLSDLSPFGRGK